MTIGPSQLPKKRHVMACAAGLSLLIFTGQAEANKLQTAASRLAKSETKAESIAKQRSGRKAQPRSSAEADLAARLQAAGLRLGAPAFLRVFKTEAELELWLEDNGRYRRFKTYRICKWSGVIGPKLAEGDRQSPEGFYTIARWQLRPRSRNHRAIDVGYPNAHDLSLGRTGSYIQIHGGCGSIGCFAMTDKAIDEIYDIVDAAFEGGQKRVGVHIFPFRMADRTLRRNKKSKWFGFWRRLQLAHDQFERTHRPPDVQVCGNEYMIGRLSPTDTAIRCVPVWHGMVPGKIAKRATGKTARPRIKVRCNLRRPSCKRWLALAKRRLRRKSASKAARRVARNSNRSRVRATRRRKNRR